MPDKITMDKRIHLGYGQIGENYVLAGRHLGFDIWIDEIEKDYVEIWVYDRSRTKRQRTVFTNDIVDTYKIAGNFELSKRGKYWHVDFARVDSRFRGKKLARKMYSFLIKKGYNLQAGDSQSPGGRYVWNELAKDRTITIFAKKSKHSKFIDFPRPGKNELKSSLFELFDSKAEIYAVSN
jgi:hypothetical protein